MAILPFNVQESVQTRNANAANSANGRTSGERKPDAQLWLNIGYMALVHEDEPEQFISLPYGIPLDTMSQATTRGNNEDSVVLAGLKNEFLADILEQAAALLPGEDVVIPCEGSDIAVQIRRVKEKVTLPLNESGRLAPKRQLFAINRAA